MNAIVVRIRYWAPRVMCIAFAAFLSLFALDVFTMPLGPGEKAVALAMHLIPTAIVLVTLLVVWRWEWIGALAFPALAVYHLVSFWERRMDWSGYAVIEVPLVLLGVLFLLSWRDRQAAVRQARAAG